MGLKRCLYGLVVVLGWCISYYKIIVDNGIGLWYNKKKKEDLLMDKDLRAKYDDLRHYGSIVSDVQKEDEDGVYRVLKFYYMDKTFKVLLVNGIVIYVNEINI